MRNTFIALILLALAIAACKGCRSGRNGNNKALDYPLDSIPVDSSLIHICSSEDGKIKFYCWDTEEGGTCPIYGVLCQIRTEDGGSKIIDMYDGPWFDHVNAITKDDGMTYYIATTIHRSSSSCGYMSLWAYKIEGDSVREVSPYDGGDDLDNCTLEFEYDIYDWYHRTMGEGWNWLFEYDAASKNLYVPSVRCGSESLPQFTDRYRVLHFDGMSFCEVGFQAHRGLHESLQEYDFLVRYFRTDDYIGRIDQLEDKSLRFALWKRPNAMSDEPEVIVVGGKYEEVTDTYSFQQDGMHYILGPDNEFHIMNE